MTNKPHSCIKKMAKGLKSLMSVEQISCLGHISGIAFLSCYPKAILTIVAQTRHAQQLNSRWRSLQAPSQS